MQQRFAYLGPEGSYTERALREFAPEAERSSCRSISEIFEIVSSGTVPAGFVPVENVLEGPVNETLDLLLEYRGKVYIEDSHLLPINHALGTLPGTELKDITAVYSHPQALRQCSRYLRKEFPSAQILPTQSTTAAIEQVNKNSLRQAGVIAAKASLQENGFDVAAESIADFPNNQTRFIVIKPGNIDALDEFDSDTSQLPPLPKRGKNEELVTSVLLHPGRDRQGLLSEIIEIISVQHGINLLSIHSRPDSRGGFVFNMDLEGHLSQAEVRQCLQSLKEYCRDTTGQTAELAIFGCCKRRSFNRRAFNTIGIIGGKGAMGAWLERAFTQAGCEVLICDLNSEMSMKELTEKSDVVFLSVPMASIQSVVEELAEYLQPGQLLVENCTIKNSALPHIMQLVSDEIEVLGIHTLFGPSADSFRGESIVITQTQRSRQKAKAFEDLLYKHGAKTMSASESEHDKASAYHQSLVHLIIIALADALSAEFELADDIDSFSTPNSRSLRDMMARLLEQSDSLISDIQLLNKEAPALRKRFLQTLFGLVSSLEYDDISPLMDSVKRGREFLEK